jgi:hypothetical protein
LASRQEDYAKNFRGVGRKAGMLMSREERRLGRSRTGRPENPRPD